MRDDHDVVDRLCDLGQNMARDQHRSAGIGERAQVLTQPVDTFRVEPVGGFVQDQHLGLAEERAGQAEPLAHAEREALDPAVARIGEVHLVEHGVDAAEREPCGESEHPQVIARPPARVERVRLEDRADVAKRRVEVGVAPAADRGRAAGQRHQAEQHPQRRGLTRAVSGRESRSRIPRAR